MIGLLSAPSVVVGIDGSRAAADAALWAIDEAVSRDIPLRLVYVIDPAPPVEIFVTGTRRGCCDSGSLGHVECSVLTVRGNHL